jgi:hypothetical protein
MSGERPSAGPPSERQLSRRLGISRTALWRAKKVAEIPEDEFEALIERDSPMTVTQLVAHSRKRAAPAPGKDSLLTVRAPLEIIDAVDTWAAKNGYLVPGIRAE